MADKTVRFTIKRQPTPDASPHWGEFDLRWRPGMNVITGLMDISENAVDRFGKPTIPVTYDSNCLEEVCGSCAMLINGRAAMACSALVHKLKQPIRLEPPSRFPVVRDLAVDRSVLFGKRVKAWVPVGDGGIHECAYAQNCVQICPKGIPLTTSISIVYGQVMKTGTQRPVPEPRGCLARRRAAQAASVT